MSNGGTPASRGSTPIDTYRAALTAYPELRRLVELREGGGWFFQPVQVHGDLELLAGARTWPDGWSDAIAIRDLGDTRAFRCDNAGGEVWKHEGSLIEVIDALAELPAPYETGAPRLVKAKAPTLWVPRSYKGGFGLPTS